MLGFRHKPDTLYMVEVIYKASGLKEYHVFGSIEHARDAIRQLSFNWDIDATILKSDPEHWKVVE